MFKIQGADQKEYGPVSTDALRQWIAERRVNGKTLVQVEGGAAWKPLAEFPEFAAALAAGGPPPILGAAAPVQPLAVGATSEPAKTSGMAIASVVCGVLGCLGITALVGIVLGAMAQYRISKSGGRLKGTGLAITGICVSAVMLMVVVPVGLLLPALGKVRQRAQAINCAGNMKQIALAVRLYSNDNKDTFPTANSWCDVLQTYVADPRLFQCRADRSGQRCSFALNRKIAGMTQDKIDPRTVVLFEAHGGWNAAGGPEMAARSRHGSRVVVAFADGSVSQIPVSNLPTLRWNP